MNGNNQGLLGLSNIQEYVNKLKKVHAGMAQLGFGAQRACSDYIDEPPAMVSRVVRGILIDEFVLNKMEEWLEAVEANTR